MPRNEKKLDPEKLYQRLIHQEVIQENNHLSHNLGSPSSIFFSKTNESKYYHYIWEQLDQTTKKNIIRYFCIHEKIKDFYHTIKHCYDLSQLESTIFNYLKIYIEENSNNYLKFLGIIEEYFIPN